MQPVNTMAVQIVIRDASQPQPQAAPGFAPPAPAFRFATTAGDRWVQISDVSFVYQTTAPYPGWASVKPSSSMLK